MVTFIDAPLYKFFSNASAYFECAMRRMSDDEIYCSTIGELNDPWEAIASIEDDVPETMAKLAKLMGYTGEQLDNFRSAPESVRSLMLKNFGIFCCSVKKAGSDPLDNFLLWSHYANGGKGICVELDPMAMGAHQDSSNGLIEMDRITYQDAHANIGIDSAFNFLFEKTEELDRTIINNMFYQKHICWQYESELRLLSSSSGYLKLRRNPVKAIYFGPRADELTISNVKRWMGSESGIKYYYSSIQNYGLVFFEIV